MTGYEIKKEPGVTTQTDGGVATIREQQQDQVITPQNTPATAQDVYNASIDATNAAKTGLAKILPFTPTQFEVREAKPVTTYSDLYKQYYDRPMSEEETERRKRAATNVNAVRHFGNALNAFSNLIFTGKGAPSQTLPTIQDPNLQAFSDKARDARTRYAEAMAKATSMDDAATRADRRERDEAIARNNQIETQRYNMDVQRWQQEYGLNKDEAAAMAALYANKQKEDQVKFAQDMEKKRYGLQAAQYALHKKESELRIKELSDKNYVRMVDGAGKLVEIPSHNLNDQTIRYLFSLLTEDDQKKANEMYGYKSTTTNDGIEEKTKREKKPLSQAEMLYAIGEFIGHSEKAQAALRDLGATYVNMNQTNRYNNDNVPPSQRGVAGNDLDNVPPSQRKKK